MTDLRSHFDYHQRLLMELYQYSQGQLPFSSDQASEVDHEFIESLQQLSEENQLSDDYKYRGQAIISRVIANYPHLTASVNRDLFWFFGGDCLHYMSDNEIELYQQLDEVLYEAQSRGSELEFSIAMW